MTSLENTIELYALYNGGFTISFGSLIETENDALEHVRIAATMDKEPTLYRVFTVLPDGSKRFKKAWSLIDGIISEHNDVSIPAIHW